MGSTAADAGPMPPPEFDWGQSRHHHWRGPSYRSRKRRSFGFVLIALGLLFLGAQSHVFNLIPWNVAWPLVLIVLGGAMLMRHRDWRL